MTIETRITPDSLARLRAAVSGPVFARGDAGLAEEVAGFNTVIAHQPDVVVGAATQSDVVETVRFAASIGLPVRVHSTGHGAFTSVAGGVLISTKRLDTLEIDPERRHATIGAGVKWQAVIAAASEFGLAPIIGSSPGVGAIGFTLGGGLGPLVRSHGATVDWVRGFRMVTAAGELVTANTEQHIELFWALRGGKGGLGVVTEMTIELAPLATLYGGGLFFDGEENIETALRAWGEWAQTAPERVTTSVAIMRMPDFEMMPPPLRGRTLLHLRFAYPGEAAEGERLISPLRACAPVYIDAVAEMPFAAIGSIHNDPEEGSPAWVYGTMLDSLDQDALTLFLEHLGPAADSPFFLAEVRHLGGTPAHANAPDTATGGRNSAFMLTLVALDPSTFAQTAPRASAAFADEAAAWLASVTNVNFAGDPDDPTVFARAWSPETHARLAEVRGSYDPAGLFAFGPAR